MATYSWRKSLKAGDRVLIKQWFRDEPLAEAVVVRLTKTQIVVRAERLTNRVVSEGRFSIRTGKGVGIQGAIEPRMEV